MVAYASYTAQELLSTPDDAIFARLIRSDAASGFSQFSHKQGWSWGESIRLLKATCKDLIAIDGQHRSIGVVLEYRIPRREKRLDAAFLFNSTIAIVEFKAGSSEATGAAIAQVSDYCLDLAYYHAQSQGKKIIPIVCSTEAKFSRVVLASNVTLIEDIQCVGEADLAPLLRRIASEDSKIVSENISHEKWCSSAYRPIPGIIETTVSLFNKHNAEDINAALADRDTIDQSIEAIQGLVQESHKKRQKTLCLLTGVPGAGKTLTGLRIAHSPEFLQAGSRSVFLSGNGPLLRVLKAALAVDYKERQGCTKAIAQRHAESLLHSVHAYLAEAQKSQSPPSENIVIFDEAQRAWDEAKMQKMATRQRSFGAVSELSPNSEQASEPSQILGVMDRHKDGAVVIALCGSGQEIHDGEAGVGEWIAARNRSYPHWRLVCSPSAIELAGGEGSHAEVTSKMHLGISLRSHRTSEHAAWVDAVLTRRPEDARKHVDQTGFPIVLVRRLEEARQWLRKSTLGSRRFGLVASSGCSRLRPYGIEVSAGLRKELDYAEWFTAPRGDLRSSFALETAATEFECQGLELDRVAVCWGWDLILDEQGLVPRTFRGTGWSEVGKARARSRQYIINKYRVLLTRAREGMVIWVPLGDEEDQTRSTAEMDRLAVYLVDCGAQLA
jgi:hypothetical protein